MFPACWRAGESCLRYRPGGKRLTLTHPEIRRELIALLGEEVYCGQQLNKTLLAVIFLLPERMQNA